MLVVYTAMPAKPAAAAAAAVGGGSAGAVFGFVLMPEPLTAAPVLSVVCTGPNSSSSSSSKPAQAHSTPEGCSSNDAPTAPSQQCCWLPQPQLLQLVQAAARSKCSEASVRAAVGQCAGRTGRRDARHAERDWVRGQTAGQPVSSTMQLVDCAVCFQVLRQFLWTDAAVGVETQRLVEASKAATAAAAESAAAKAAEQAARTQAKAEAAAAAAAGLEQPDAAAADAGERAGTSSSLKRPAADTAADMPSGKRAAVDLAAVAAAASGAASREHSSHAALSAGATLEQQQAACAEDDGSYTDWVERLRAAGVFEPEEPTATEQQFRQAGGATALANVQQYSARPQGKWALPGGWHCHSDTLGAAKITAYVSQHAQHNSTRYGGLRLLACRDAEKEPHMLYCGDCDPDGQWQAMCWYHPVLMAVNGHRCITHYSMAVTSHQDGWRECNARREERADGVSAAEATKLCTMCPAASAPKPLAQFWRNSTRPDGRSSICIQCTQQQRERKGEKVRIRLHTNFGRILRGGVADAQSQTLEHKLGYSVAEFRQHIEQQLRTDPALMKQDGSRMSWTDWGAVDAEGNGRSPKDYWTLGHRVPVSAFDVFDDEQRRSCFALSNLFPQVASHNYADGSVCRGGRHVEGLM